MLERSFNINMQRFQALIYSNQFTHFGWRR